MNTTTYIFAGGGTGGHIFPALAITEQLKHTLGDRCRCIFLCSDRPIDASILAPEGVEFHALKAKPIAANIRAIWTFALGWKPSVRQTLTVIREAKKNSRVHLVAMGGFVAAPAVQAAQRAGVPITLVNLDAAPGKANRWIAKRCSAAYTTVPSADFPNWITVPPIVRAAATNTRSQRECCVELGLDPDLNVLMITGGSQGADSINQLLETLIRDRGEAFNGWQVIHQCGLGHEDRVRAAYRDRQISASVVSFTRQMGLWWGAADLAVSRAGAGAVAEAWGNRVPTVFLPYPYHADQHQKFNAMELARLGAAAICTDHVAPAANMKDAGELLVRLLTDADALDRLKSSALHLPPAHGAAQIAEKLVQMAR